MAAPLKNNEELKVVGGNYAVKVSGAMDLQWQLADEGFVTIPGGSFTGETSVIVDLPKCTIKIINAGANTLRLKVVR